MIKQKNKIINHYFFIPQVSSLIKVNDLEANLKQLIGKFRKIKKKL